MTEPNRLKSRFIYGLFYSSFSIDEALNKNDFLDDFFRQYESLTSGKASWFLYKQVKSNQLINLLIIMLWRDRVIGHKKYDRLSDYIME